MSLPLLTLWCDSATNRLVSGWQSATPAADPILIRGDNLGVEVHWVSTITSSTAAMVEVPFPPAATVTLAIGGIDSVPSDGTWTVTYGANTTAPLAYNITAAALQTALNALAGVTADGGVTVSQFGISYKVLWNNPGARTNSLVIASTNLFPTSYGESTVSRVGDASTNHTVLLTLRRSPIAACTSFTTVPEPTLSITSIFDSAWRVAFDHPPRTGTYTLTLTLVKSGGGTETISTQPIQATANANDVYSALSAATLTSQAFVVTDSGQGSWDISAASGITSSLWTGTANVTAVTASSAAIGFSSVYGVLNLNTAEVEEFMSGLSEAQAVLAINVDAGGTRQTILQTTVTISNELITNESFTLVDMGTVMPVDSVVRYDTSQSLTDPQKATARLNIAAALNSDVTALQSLTTTQGGQISSIVSSLSGYAPLNSPHFTGLPELSSSGIKFSDGTIQTTAATGGGGGSYDQSLNTFDPVTFVSVTANSGISPIKGVLQNYQLFVGNVLTYTGTTVDGNGVTFQDGSFLGTANPFDQSLNKADAPQFGGLLIANTARPGEQGQFIQPCVLQLSGAYVTGGIGTVIMTDGLGHSMTLDTNGITFKDGTVQTTAAAPASAGVSQPLIDWTQEGWTLQSGATYSTALKSNRTVRLYSTNTTGQTATGWYKCDSSPITGAMGTGSEFNLRPDRKFTAYFKLKITATLPSGSGLADGLFGYDDLGAGTQHQMFGIKASHLSTDYKYQYYSTSGMKEVSLPSPFASGDNISVKIVNDGAGNQQIYVANVGSPLPSTPTLTISDLNVTVYGNDGMFRSYLNAQNLGSADIRVADLFFDYTL